MTAPRVSVLMPCYNHGAFLDEAVESVLTQTVQDFEILIVNDGSTDPATVEKLRTYSAPRTRVLHTINQGLPAARNHAAAHATGSVFCALDADDRLAPTWFEKALAVLDARPEIAFVSHWLETFGDERWVWQPASCELPDLLARNTVNGAALVRRTAFEQAGGYDASMRHGCEDWDLWLRLVERGLAGTIVPEVLFFYRRRADSMSRVMVEQEYRAPLTALVTRHEAAYRRHLVDVLLSTEHEARHLVREVDRLESDRLCMLEPAMARAGEELRALDAPIARAERDIAAREAQAQAAARIGALEGSLRAEQQHAQVLASNLDAMGHERARLAAVAGEVPALRAYAEGLRTEVARSDSGARSLQLEIDALRQSVSWRLTEPFRRILGWLGRRS